MDSSLVNNVINGTDEDDVIFGTQENDVISGGEGNDTLIGGSGSDTISGGAGNDFIMPDQERFSLNADNGNVDPGSQVINVIDGGAGNDTIDIVDPFTDVRSTHQILFGRGSGQDIVTINEFGVDPAALDLVSVIFTNGLSPEDIELDIAPSQQLNALQDDIFFRIIDTGEALVLDADFGLFLDIVTLNFDHGVVLNLGDFDAQDIVEQTIGNQTINLSSLVGGPIEPQRVDTVDDGATSLLQGSTDNENFLLGGLDESGRSIASAGGSDRLVLNSEAVFAVDEAGSSNGHYRVQDFVIDDVSVNQDADVLDIGNFLLGANLDASTIGNYLFVVSGVFGAERSVIFVDREGQFTDQDRANLLNNVSDGGQGADLVFEFQGRAANNNLAELTGFEDNSVEQFQALIDSGFLDISNANSQAIARPEEGDAPIVISGSSGADNLLGSDNDDIFLSGGLSQGVESIRGNGGNDVLVLTAGDSVAQDSADNSHAHFRIRDFVIGDVDTNSEADVLDLSDLLSGFSINAENLGDHLHIISGTFGTNRSSIFIDRDGQFDAAERAELTADVSGGGQGADLFLEFQGLEESNNLEQITGFADNTQEQLQSLIDLGFLDIA